MSREEDLVRSTAAAIAATVPEVPPLRLPTVGDGPHAVARHARGTRGAPGRRGAPATPGRRAAGRLRGWLVPAGAAAVVLAIALSLVFIRHIPSGGVAAAARPAPAVDGVPAYYAGLAKAGIAATSPEEIVVGQTVTGKRLATVTPPAGTTFAGITGAADDRTFVVDTQPGSLDPEGEPWQPRTWYLLRIDPGSATAARLTPLPIPPTAQGTNVAGIALSPDGTDLAVAVQPDGLNDPSAPTYLRVYSVATGAVLHSWFATAASDASGQPQLFDGSKEAGPDSNLALGWDGQRGLAFGYSRVIPAKTADGSDLTPPTFTLVQIRYLSLQAKDGGDLISASQVVASLARGTRMLPTPLLCGVATLDHVLVTGDRPTLICGGFGGGSCPGGTATTHCAAKAAIFDLGLVEYTDGASAPTRVLATYTTRFFSVMALLPLWSNPAGTTQLGLLNNSRSATALQFGIFSKGRFTALPMPPTAGGGYDRSPLNYVAW